MLGSLYDRLDDALGKPTGHLNCGVFTPEDYTSIVLAELLDRCDVLCSLMRSGGQHQMMSDEDVQVAFSMFAKDCEEARARGERLGLFGPRGQWTEASGEFMSHQFNGKVEVHPHVAKLRQEEREKWKGGV